MTQEEIRRRRDAIALEFEQLRYEYLGQKMQLEARMLDLRKACAHENTESETSLGGDYFKECLDCGETWF